MFFFLNIEGFRGIIIIKLIRVKIIIHICLKNATANEWNQCKYWIDLGRTLWTSLVIESNW